MNTLLSVSPLACLFDTNKGDIKNRADCASEQFKNNFKANLKNTALITGGGMVGYTILKSPAKTSTVVKSFDKVAGLASKVAPKIATKLKNLPGVYKVIGLVAIPVLTGVAHVISKHSVKAGEINQKYNDRAQLKEQANVMIA